MVFPSNGPVLRPDARHHTDPETRCTEAFFHTQLSLDRQEQRRHRAPPGPVRDR